MKKYSIKKQTRILAAFLGLALIIVLFVPLWKIDLIAPQYPEGLELLIYPNRLGGNVDIINGLNHYIGMKTLHSGDFIEFTILPYIIVFFSLLLLITALVNNRRLFFIVVTLFICFGIIAMVDFWRWEYDYGHNLDPNAAIIVPGMAYQPPLIGYKQLLNFEAFSQPHIGGWIFAITGFVLLFLAIMEFFAIRKQKRLLVNPAIATTAIVLSLFISSCNAGPEPIVLGKDHCEFCKMTISDDRFGAEIVTTKGKVFKFDDSHCIIAYMEKEGFNKASVKDIYFKDFSSGHSLINTKDAFFLKSDQLQSPMGGNVAAFSNKDSLTKVSAEFAGTTVSWSELYH
ncbi:MAG: nitrous oxide reductase accessory protein NosL [Bacteroidetes bacterium]|nr:nitrous oxide reductase accessory protein NosL [Bacteroidota bacterium]MBS1633131.1 nitrous oxide reductase accessory protein NosL [Bacteroidota bacterium]